VIDLLEDAVLLQSFCEAQAWSYCFIGGIAVQRWSEPRITRDLDLSLFVGFGNEEHFIDSLLQSFAPRRPDAKAFALRHRVLLLESSQKNGIDISMSALPFEQSAISRSTWFEFAPNVTLRTCSAEDLMIMKLFASRPLDIRDAEGIAIRHGHILDWAYIETNLAPLAEAKEAPEIMSLFATLRSGQHPKH